MIKGVDVSHYESGYNFHQAVKDGVAFMMTKATEGVHADPTCHAQVASARAAGIKYCGAYCFFHAAVDVDAQVEAYKKVTAGLQLEMPAILDLEETSVDGLDYATVKEAALQWLQSFDKAILYIDLNMIQLLNLDERFAKYIPWIADYSSKAPTSNVLGPWDKWVFWQFTDSGELGVDTNWFNGSLDDLSALFAG